MKELKKGIELKNLGSLLRGKRKELNLTQSEVAEEIGLSTQHYSRIERGEYTPGLQTFINLNRVLKLNLSEMDLRGEEAVSPTMYEIMFLLKHFNNTQQKAVLSFLKTMASA